MFGINEANSITEEFKNDTRIHEHDFISISTEEKQKSIVCLTCGLLYCNRCCKLLVTIHDKTICSIIIISITSSKD